MVKDDVFPAPRFAVEERSARHGAFEHFFQTERLGADLHFVATVWLGPTAFVFDREGPPSSFYAGQDSSRQVVAFVHRMKLDDVGHADQAKPVGAQGETARDAQLAPGARCFLVDLFVKLLSLDGASVLCPDAFNMNEGKLPFTKKKML